MATLILTKTVSFHASRARIWNLLTDPAQTKQYMFGCAVQSDWLVGSPINWVGHNQEGQHVTFVKGKITAIEPGHRVAFTMIDPHSGMADIPDNYARCTYQLTESNAETTLKITQDFTGTQDAEKRHAEAATGWEQVIGLMQELAKN